MTRHLRPVAIGLLACFAATALAQSPHAPLKHVRDLAPATAESVGMSSERLTRLNAAMKQLVDDKKVAGLVTLVERHGKIVHFNAVGQLDVRKTDAMQKDSIFRIYSMSKPVTGVAMMMLYEEGKWQINDPVSRYIPEFARLKVYTGKNDDGTPKLEDAKRSMTMRELMTHTAGLGYVLSPMNPVDKMIIDGNVLNAAAPLQTMIDGLAKIPLLAQPGTRWSYSIAVDVQGYLIEKFSGQPFGEFARKRIFEPLGMKDTGVLRSEREAGAPRAGPHRRWSESRGGHEPAGPDRDSARAVGRRRTVFDRDGLRAVLRDAARGRTIQRRPAAGAAHRRDDAHQPRESRAAEDHAAGHRLGHGLSDRDGCRGGGRGGLDRHV